MIQLQLLPDAIDEQALQISDRARRKAWREIKAACRIIGQYRGIYQNDYYARRSREAGDILAAMEENMARVRLARQVFDNGNFGDALKALKGIVW